MKKEFDWHNTGRVNIAHEAIDRHAQSWRKNKVALSWEGPNKEHAKYTFSEMKLLSDKFANVLHKAGARKGDRIFVYLPRIPELYISAVAIAKIGGIFVPLFGGFRAEAVRDRMNDCGAEMVVTTPDMKQLGIDPIRKEVPTLKTIIVCRAPEDLQVRRRGAHATTPR